MIVAHDLGTTGNKASLHDDWGRIVATRTVRYPTRFGPNQEAEQDPDDWWRAIGEATRRLLLDAGVHASQVIGVGMSGQMMGAVFLDAARRPVRPAFIWADQRARRQADRLIEVIGEQEAYRRLGHRLHATYTLPKLMWVRDNEPDLFARIRHVCVAKDYVTGRLTGALVTDPSDASSTDAYDLTRRCWSTLLLEAAEIDAVMLPEIVPSTTVAGGLTGEAAEHIGLLPGTPVVVGGGDGPIASVGAGSVAEADPAYLSLGSSAWVSFTSTEPVLDEQMRSFTFEHVVPGAYAPTATMQAGGASVAWLAECLEPRAPDGIHVLVAEAETAAAASDGLFFLPYLLGERSPHWNANAAGAFLGLNRHHGRGAMMRAVLEGVAFNLRSLIDAFTANGRAIDRLDVIGGGTASDVWLQLMSNVWGIPLARRSIVEEANSLGAAVTAMVGLGEADFALAKDLSTITHKFVPDDQAHAEYEAAYPVFHDGYRRLEPWFDTRFPGGESR